MKKFEIVNDKWIKQLDFEIWEKSFLSRAAKINSISFISSFETATQYRYLIRLQTDSAESLSFHYTDIEKDQYYSDLKFLENLLYNQ